MARYASADMYGGQRATVGRVVVVAIGGGEAGVDLRAGVVAQIRPSGRPLIEVGGCPGTELLFVDAKTVDDVEAMPPGSWTWPPRVS